LRTPVPNAREWDETAFWLVASHQVVALDARDHGAMCRLVRVATLIVRGEHDVSRDLTLRMVEL
jgi:hypothetical protein